MRLLATVDRVEGVDLREHGGVLEHRTTLLLIVSGVENFLQAKRVVVTDLPPTELSAALSDPAVTGGAPVGFVLNIAQAFSGVVTDVVEGCQPSWVKKFVDGGDDAIQVVGVDGVVRLALTRIDLTVFHGVAEVVLATVLN